MVIGIAKPDPVQVDGSTLAFDPLNGVASDVRFYRDLLAHDFRPADDITVHEYTSHARTTAAFLEREIQEVVNSVPDGGLFVLCVTGHGIQVVDVDGDEGSGSDQALVTSRGIILDDYFRDLWHAHAQRNLSVLAFADTCHSDSLVLFDRSHADAWQVRRRIGSAGPNVIALGVRGKARSPAPEPSDRTTRSRRARTSVVLEVIDTAAPAPSRLIFSASQKSEPAGDGRRGGVFTRALAQAWDDPRSRESYRTWFALARERVKGQHPTLRYRGPDACLLESAPLTVPG